LIGHGGYAALKLAGGQLDGFDEADVVHGIMWLQADFGVDEFETSVMLRWRVGIYPCRRCQ
jgi:hypothetical protein